jgi:hypothetical protein
MESESTVLSDVVHTYIEFKKVFEALNSTDSLLTLSEKLKAQSTYKTRCEGKFVSDYHYLAYFLDPRYRHSKLIESKEDLAKRVYELLLVYALGIGCIEGPADMAELADNVNHFRNSKGLYGLTLMCGKNPASFWKNLKEFPSTLKLATIGSKLLTVPASSAGVERSFSTQKRIHSSERNRLSDKNVDKLMRIQWMLNKRLKEEKDLKERHKPIAEEQEIEYDMNIDNIINLDPPYTLEELYDIDEY